MALGGLWSKLTGGIVGGAVAIATADVAVPTLEVEKQEAWASNANRVLDVGSLARLVAQALVDIGPAANQATRTGYDENKLAALVQLALEAPSVAEAQDLRRRNKISKEQFEHALAKAQIEPQYWQPLEDLIDERLDPAVIATAIQRGLLANEGILPVGPPSDVGLVPPMPMVDIDPVVESEAAGIDKSRLEVLARIVGLPPGPGELLDMLNRGIIEPPDFYRGIAEGNTRNEWGPFLEQLRHFKLSPTEYASARLRGWIDTAEMDAGGALSGASPAQMDLLFKNRGRPATPHQMWLAIRRSDATRADFDRAIVQSDIRPEYAPWLWSIRYSYPSLFQLRNATEAGDISGPRARVILGFEGYEDQDADALVASWTKAKSAGTKDLTKAELRDEYEGLHISQAEFRTSLAQLGYTGAAQDLEVALADARRVKGYRDKAIARVYKLYVAHTLDEATARADLATLNVTPEAIGNLLPLWTLERDVNVKQLTPAQVKRAYRKGDWTLERAIAELLARGYSEPDAAEYLAQ